MHIELAFCPRPVQCSRSPGGAILPGQQMEPALGRDVPGDGQRLQPAAGQFDQVLLQGIDAERVGDLEIGQLAVGPVGADEIPVPLPEELRDHALVLEVHATEVTQHGRRRGPGHRLGMMRARPGTGLGLVALHAGRIVDEGGPLRSRDSKREITVAHCPVEPAQNDEEGEGQTARKQESSSGRHLWASLSLEPAGRRSPAQNLTLKPMIGPCSTRSTLLLLPVLV